MLSIVIALIMGGGSLVLALKELYHKIKEGRRMSPFAVVEAVVIVVSFAHLMSEAKISAPYIERTTDYSAVTIKSDDSGYIEYRISTSGENSDQWIRYKEPFKLEKNAVIYARTRVFWYKSEQVFRDAFVADNGLIYFGEADQPGDMIVSISAQYKYRDADILKAGNHYAGYEIRKSDLEVVGTDLNGNEKIITDFSYTPEILNSGRNDIEVSYSLADGILINTHVFVEGDDPALISLEAKYTGETLYLDSSVDVNSFVVTGTYEDGIRKELTDYKVAVGELKEGKNDITIAKGQISCVVELMALDRTAITEKEAEPNDDIRSANEIEVNVKYSGVLSDSDDIDYYRFVLKKKGRITVKFNHPKIDNSSVFWKVYLMSQDDTEIVRVQVTGQAAETSSSTARVSPGIYYIKVEKYKYSDEKYMFTVMYEEEGDSFESEPNDNLSTQAMQIVTDEEYTGNLTSEADVDYFKFSMGEKRKVWVSFSHDKMNENKRYWNVALFDDSDGNILEFDSYGQNGTMDSDSVRLPAGDYYVRIKKSYWIDMDYTFCVHSEVESGETEDEPNDDYGQATPVKIGTSITGNLQSNKDIDFYQFDLEEAAAIEVVFGHGRSDSGSVFWKYSLFSETSSDALKDTGNSNEIKIKGNANDSVSNRWAVLSPGTYYIRVSGNTYNNGDYVITVFCH